MANPDAASSFRRLALSDGYLFNNNGGAYRKGERNTREKRVEVAAALADDLLLHDLTRNNIKAVAHQCRVSRRFVYSVKAEISSLGRLSSPSEQKAQKKTRNEQQLDDAHLLALYCLYLQDPTRTTKSYVLHLRFYTGIVVSESTVKRAFENDFPYKARLYTPNLVPHDKFTVNNLYKAVDYFDLISKVDPYRVKFGDEKALKGKEVFSRKVRKNPVTGIIPPVLSNSDFRNAYSLTGFCSIDKRSAPVYCTIHDGVNSSDDFARQLDRAIHDGFFFPGDILVLDNAAIHIGKENSVLEDYLWDRHEILLVFLPPRSPELNPIELVWNVLVQRLKLVELDEMKAIGEHATAFMANDILRDVTHNDVMKCYTKSNVL